MNKSEFLVSVCDAYGRDAATLEGIFYGKTNLSSALTMAMTSTEVRGGILNPLLYNFMHDRKVSVKIDSAAYSKTFLGLVVGSLPTNTSLTYLQTECVNLVSNAGTLTVTPTSDVSIFYQDGTVTTVTPIGKTITVTGAGTQSVNVAYDAVTTADQVTISTTNPPKIIDLTLIAQIRDNLTNAITKYLHIHIPRFQIDGNTTLNFAANAVNSQQLSGDALSVYGTDCSTGDTFGYFQEIPAAGNTTPVTEIVALPSTLLYSASGVAGNIKTLAVIGTTTVDVTSSASYTVPASGSFTAGSHTGIITSGSAWHSGATGSATVAYFDVVSGSTFYDTVNLA